MCIYVLYLGKLPWPAVAPLIYYGENLLRESAIFGLWPEIDANVPLIQLCANAVSVWGLTQRIFPIKTGERKEWFTYSETIKLQWKHNTTVNI